MLTLLYHGTWAYNLESFKKDGAKVSPRRYTSPAFCTSQSFQEATFFALRKTPVNDLSQTGIILEFDAWRLRSGEYISYDAGGLLRDEKEIRVIDTTYLCLLTFHRYVDGTWSREEV